MNRKPKFEIDRNLFPFDSHFMEMRNGATVHYVDEGESDTGFLMLHGNPTWSFVYRKLIREFSKQYRCVVPDYPGFGLSTAPAEYDFKAHTQYEVMAEFVERLALKNVILVTQDWGGPIGFALAERFPDLVSKVIAGNTWAWPMEHDLRFRTFSALMGGPFGRTIARTFNGVWRFFMMRGFVNQPSKAEMAMYAAPFRGGDNWRQTAVFPRELVKAVQLEEIAEKGWFIDCTINQPSYFGEPKILAFRKMSWPVLKKISLIAKRFCSMPPIFGRMIRGKRPLLKLKNG